MVIVSQEKFQRQESTTFENHARIAGLVVFHRSYVSRPTLPYHWSIYPVLYPPGNFKPPPPFRRKSWAGGKGGRSYIFRSIFCILISGRQPALLLEAVCQFFKGNRSVFFSDDTEIRSSTKKTAPSVTVY